ncbi:ArsR/SmtB family transcription factor [Nonomuraea purpurea]|uniref:ArsR/SmtB family transcription factor n=1 Tax=Nonomuraea purpurea TaxID=1849276 RepID=A0ABV8GV03_9ACTN
MLRIHFTTDDLAKVRLAPGPDAMWELVLSIHQLVFPAQHTPYFMPWRRRSVTALTGARLDMTARALGTLMPAADYWPDFLTPAGHIGDIEHGIETVLATPRTRLRRELVRLAATSGKPSPWLNDLSAGDARSLRHLGSALRRYHQTTISRHRTAIMTTTQADLARRVKQLAGGGVQALLRGLRPWAIWSSPVLRLRYPEDGDLHLEGRGLLLIPSFFGVHGPVLLADRSLPPVLVYPVEHPPLWRSESGEDDHVENLMGTTRATLLRLLTSRHATGALAARLNVAPSTVSRHLHALRSAGLVATARHGAQQIHQRTWLGDALLDGHAYPYQGGLEP